MSRSSFFLVMAPACLAAGCAAATVLCRAEEAWKPASGALLTRWAQQVNPREPHPEYPRPQCARNTDRMFLNGLWDYAITEASAGAPAGYQGKILVPYPIESALSGVMKPLGPRNRLWYRLSFELPKPWNWKWFMAEKQRLMLRFEGVQGDATVLLNGKELGTHRNGYDGFSFDASEACHDGQRQELVVRVAPVAGSTAAAFSGIWQTVWVEMLRQGRIEGLKIVPDADAGLLRLTVAGKAGQRRDYLEVTAIDRGSEIARTTGKFGEELRLPISHARLWSPEYPFLYDLRVELKREKSTVDRIFSYFALRKVAVGEGLDGKPAMLLNGQPVFCAAVLHAGLWPDGGLAAPTDEAIRRDVELIKQLGFNTVRKPDKIESDRWYYWCDRLGLMVWQDAGNDFPRTADLRGKHPCIVAWAVPRSAAAGDVQNVKRCDSTRLVMGGPACDLVEIPAGTGPGRLGDHQLAVLDVGPGSSAPVEGHTAGPAAPTVVVDPTSSYLERVQSVALMRRRWPVGGAVYGQFTDVPADNSGLVTADREVIKLDLERLASVQGLPLRPKGKVIIPSGRNEKGVWAREEGGPPGEIRLKSEIVLDPGKLVNPSAVLSYCGEVELRVNGVPALRLSGKSAGYYAFALPRDSIRALKAGPNTLSVHCRKLDEKGPQPQLDVSIVEMERQWDVRLPMPMKPLLDEWMRDACICLGPDGTYYLTGTGSGGDWQCKSIRLWKSKDLKHWDYVGVVWDPASSPNSWMYRGRKSVDIWAPELHYLKGNFWYVFCISYPQTQDGAHGTGLLRSTSGKAQGPYELVNQDAPLSPGLDATLFQDDDGKVYFLFGGCDIGLMKDDMSGLVHGTHRIGLEDGGTVGYEGIFLFKEKGKYYLAATDNPLPDGDYDCMVAIADKLAGPYRQHHMAIPHGGHNMFFQDRQGQWWSTMFGGDWRAPYIERPMILPIEFAPDGTIHPRIEPKRQP